MRRSRVLSILFLSVLGVGEGARAGGQSPPEIALDPSIECWYHSQFPVLAAMVNPPEDIVRSRLYFRCSLYQDYYFVDLQNENGAFRGVAPQAEETCPRVHYYVEALSSDFASARTEERVAEVTAPDECRRRFPAAAWFPGDDPKILLGSLGTTGFAPGFKSVGIAGFISSTGGAVALGAAEGGLSTGMIAGVAGGAAAAGLGVLAGGGGGSSSTTSAIVAGPPPSSTTTTSAPAVTTTAPSSSALKACFTLDPANGRVEVNEPLRVDGRCSEGGNDISFRYDLGDGRVREGQAFIQVTWPNPGNYLLTLTVIRAGTSARTGQSALEEDSLTREIRVEEPPVADFTVTSVGACAGEFDGSPSEGDIVRYLWELDLRNDLGQGTIAKEGRVVRQAWNSEACREGNLTVRLTVVGRSGSRHSTTKVVNILGESIPLNLRTDAVETSIGSQMLEAKDARGQIVLEGGASFPVSSAAPAFVRYQGRKGSRAIEAVATSSGEAFLWKLDFTGARGFVPGSLRTTVGQEVSRDAYSVTLRFSGGAMERARIEYRLEP